MTSSSYNWKFVPWRWNTLLMELTIFTWFYGKEFPALDENTFTTQASPAQPGFRSSNLSPQPDVLLPREGLARAPEDQLEDKWWWCGREGLWEKTGRVGGTRERLRGRGWNSLSFPPTQSEVCCCFVQGFGEQWQLSGGCLPGDWEGAGSLRHKGIRILNGSFTSQPAFASKRSSKC